MKHPAMKPKILVVDDEKNARENLRRYLTLMDYEVSTAEDGQTALEIATKDPPALVITDADMPRMDGFALCGRLKKLRQTRNVPLIMISGKAVDDDSILSGFEEGVDDYVIKPVSMPILIARIKVVLRRYEKSSKKDELMRKCGIVLDPARRSATVEGRSVELTRKEFDLLTVLMEASGRVLSPTFLLEAVWGYDASVYKSPHTVTVHISRLRKKLGPVSAAHIRHVSGVGYKFAD